MNRFFSLFRANTRAAIDLASIMVGIIIIGIIGGVVAATVFAVIPWAQNNGAKSTLDSVSTSESAYRGLSSDNGGTGAFGSKTQLLNYVGGDNKKSSLINNSSLYDVQAGVDSNGDSCWAAVVKSGSGAYFYSTNAATKPVQVDSFVAAQQGVSVDCNVTLTAPNNNVQSASKCDPVTTASDVFAMVQAESSINCTDATQVYGTSSAGANDSLGATVVNVSKDTNSYTFSAVTAPSAAWGNEPANYGTPSIECLYWAGSGTDTYSTTVSYYPTAQYNGACATTTMAPSSVTEVTLHAIILNTNGQNSYRTLWTN